MATKRRKRKNLLFLAILGLCLLVAAPVLATPSATPADRQIHESWQRADAIGRFSFASATIQTNHPTSIPANIGRRATTERFDVQGDIDRTAREVVLQLWPQGRGVAQSLMLKVEDGLIYGRAGEGDDWLPVEDAADLFMQNSRPLSFLAAVENARPPAGGLEDSLFPSELLPDALASSITRYRFDLNGLKYARYMRDMMEDELHRTGELPAGMSLALVQQFVDMTGEGELWLDANGLPYRQIVNIRFPPGDHNVEWVEARIITDYSNWNPRAADLAGLDWSRPAAALAATPALLGLHPPEALTLLAALGYTLLIIGGCALLFSRRYGRRARIAFTIIIIAAMLSAPLLQVRQAAAFLDHRAAQNAAAQPQSAPVRPAAAVFQPTVNPLTALPDRAQNDPATSALAPVESALAVPARLAQADTCTVGESSDCDQDGLTDKVEIFELGTFADDVDTDNDGISDNIEVAGFSVGGQTWYMNPRDPDSNHDGLPDGLECSARHNVGVDGTVDSSVKAVTCADTDKDGVPDVWDYDNDKDGVPDTVDDDPFTFHTVIDKQFGLTLAGYEAEKSLFVDITVRPTDSEHLWWTNNYLDWPDLDQQGQIMRVTTNTLSADGDMLLSPVLEITIPYDSHNPSRGLPVKSGVNVAAIKATDAIDNWLDQDTLDLYGMVVSQDTDGTLVVFAPLNLTQDVVGQTPVAWHARVYYEVPAAATDWGQDHEMKVLWTVNGINDQCTPPTGETFAGYCDVGANRENTTNLSHWTTTKSVLQTYYDDFIVTALTVQEEHGVDAAVIAQKSGASGAGPHYDNYLWHMGKTLAATFLQAQLISGKRMSVADIGAQYPNWGIPAAALSFDHLTGLDNTTAFFDALAGDNVIAKLNAIYPGASKGDTANLLFVGDKTFRTIGLDEEVIAAEPKEAGSFFTLDLSGATTATTGFLRWSPYGYDGATWSNVDLVTYLGDLETGLDSVFTTSQIQSLAGGASGYDESSAQAGAVNLALNYYTSLYSGAVTWLENGSTVLSNGDLLNSDHSLPSEPVVAVVGELLDEIQNFYIRISLSNLSLTATLYDELESVATSAWVSLSSSRGLIMEALGQVVQGDTATSNTLALDQLQYAPTLSGDLSNLLNAGALDHAYKSTIGTAESYGSGATQLTLAYYATYKGLYKIYSAYKYFTGSIPKVPRLLNDMIDEYQTWLWLAYAGEVGLAIGSFALAWGEGKITPGSPAFAEKLAFEISSIIVATIVLVVLSVATGGIVLGILAVLSVIDAVTAAICAAVGVKPGSDVDQWVCGGLTGALVTAITYIINDYTPLVDLTHDGRLGSDMSTPTITQGSDTPGFAVANTINLTTSITSTLYFGHPNWMGYAYADTQLTDDNLDDSTFAYQLQTEKQDISLNLNGTTWDAIGGTGLEGGIPTGPRFRGTFDAPVAYTVAADEAGVNTGLGIYLAEGYAMKAQDCWLILGDPVCWIETDKDTNQTDLSGDIIFDIFPETIDDFHALASVGSDSYHLAWDSSFPTLVDADGDGVRSKLAGGADPDDSQADSDGDGLSDGYEQDYGSDPTTADADKDGLTDYWEAFFLTDPYEADSDGDGLLDSEEAFHPNWIYPYENSPLSDTNPPPNAPSQSSYAGGWEIVYDYSDSTPLKSWVSASPVDYDSDDDSIDDLREEIYGYNPQAASTLAVLGLHTEVQAKSGNTTYPVPYATLSSSLGYTAVISNELSSRWALGLLQTELPTDQVRSTKELGILQPRGTVTLEGSVPASDSGLSGSGTTAMTVRAGAIVEGSDGHVLWLRMNEAEGATTFADSSVYQHDFHCVIYQTSSKCPTANGSYLTFSPSFNSGYDQILIEGADWLPPTDFTLAMWVRVDSSGLIQFLNNKDSSNNLTVESDNYSLKLLTRGDTHDTGYDFVQGRWTHVLITYDDSISKTTAYINGIQQWSATTANLQTGSTNNQLIGAGLAGTKFAMDEVELFNKVLDTSEIEQLFGQPVLDVDFETLQDTSPSGNTLSCTSGTNCPAASGSGAYFNQKSFVTAGGSALNFSGDEFTFSAWIKPETRTTPFDTNAVSVYNNLPGALPRTADNTYDWQGIFGETSADNTKSLAPSLYVNPKGQMRMAMGGGTNVCHVETAEGLIAYDTWQHVTVSYDGSVFTFYINGEKVAVSDDACAAITAGSAGNLQIGRASKLGTLYFEKVYFSGGGDGGGKYELRINLDGDHTVNNIWNASDSTSNGPITHSINFAYYLPNDSSHTFRFWEDDEGGTLDYHGCTTGCDDSYVDTTVSNTGLGSTSADFHNNDLGSADFADGTLYWSMSNDFFQGSIDQFKAYTRAFSDEDALKLYEASYDGLYFNFDEAPGANTFADAYDDNVEAACDYSGGTCPDSGIAGIANQSAHFQGGIDYLQLPEIDLLQTLDSDFTIGAWINPDRVSGIQRILAAARDDSANGFGFGLNGNKLLFTTFGIKDYNSSATVTAGKWQHVAVVFDSSNAASFYVNGVFVDKVTGTQPAATNSDDPYRIGSGTNQNGSGATNEPFYGRIDDLVVETRGLDATGIQRVMQDAPLLNLHLDEDLLTTSFVDDSRYGRNAVCSGDACPGAGDKGQIRESVVFDGENDLLTVPATTNLSLPEFTIGLWVNPTEIKSDYQPLVVRENATGGDRNFGLFIHPGSMDVNMSMSNSACSAYVAQTVFNNPLLQHQWNHVVFTFDGTTQRLYINGTERGSHVPGDTPCLSNQPVQIGNEVSKFVPFAGGIDEVTIRGRALSSFEIADIFNYQSAWFDVKETHTIVIDNDNPTVSIDRASKFLPPGETIIKIAAQDPTSDVVRVRYEIAGYTGVLDATNTNGVWTFPFNYTNEGGYGIVLEAIDSVGHTTTSTEQLFVDALPPAGIAGSLPPHAPTDGILFWSNIFVNDTASTTGANSGVDKNSVFVTVRDRHGDIVGAPTQLQWQTDVSYTAQIPFTFDPYGDYTFTVTFADNVGNRGSFVQPWQLESLGPHADVMLHAGTTITPGMTLNGIASDIEHIWQSRSLQLHFEDGAGATSFLDTSGNEFVAKCATAASCPTVEAAGKHVDALSFDGNDDVLTLADSDAVMNASGITGSLEERLGIAGGSFTIMAWVNASTLAGQRPLLGTNPFEDDQELWVGFFEGRPIMVYGDHSVATADTLPAGEWAHVAFRFDMDSGEQSIFLNGELVGSATGRSAYTGTDHTIYIGQADPATLRFAGLMDEFAVYGLALTDDRIYDIANPVDSGLSKIQVRFRHVDDDGQTEEEGTWYEATFTSGSQSDIFRTWTLTVPSGLNGSYKIDLLATDSHGISGAEAAAAERAAQPPDNRRFVPGVWIGMVATGGAQPTSIYMPVIGGRP